MPELIVMLISRREVLLQKIEKASAAVIYGELAKKIKAMKAELANVEIEIEKERSQGGLFNEH